MLILTRRFQSSYSHKNRKMAGYMDHLTVRVQPGIGGDGAVHFAREPFRPTAPPDGGDGGRGSDIWVEILDTNGHYRPNNSTSGVKSVQSIFSVASTNGRDGRGYARVTGLNGNKGASHWAKGRDGDPVTIYVPKGTLISEIPVPPNAQHLTSSSSSLETGWDKPEHERVYIDTSHPLMPVGTRFMIAAGGQGGLGNARLSSQFQSLPKSQHPTILPPTSSSDSASSTSTDQNSASSG